MNHVHTDSLGLSVFTAAQVLKEDRKLTDGISASRDGVISAHDTGSDLKGL